jgi:hypothetical protein
VAVDKAASVAAGELEADVLEGMAVREQLELLLYSIRPYILMLHQHLVLQVFQMMAPTKHIRGVALVLLRGKYV